ncbi:MAG: hypothetical protein HKL96_02945 [Phycisphaerales bacterium]|nr:hypothetical protein [Phycisphaerales bacterium]
MLGSRLALALLLATFAGAVARGVTPQHPPTPPPTPAVSQRQIEKIMSFLQTTEPEVYAKAVVLRRSAPKKFVKLISEAAPNFRRLERLHKQDPQLFSLTISDIKLTHHSFTIAGELRQPNLPTEQAENLRQDLKQVVSQQFDIRQKIRKLELDQLTKRLEALKAQFTLREKERTVIIETRVNDLIGKPPSIHW